MKPDRKVTYDQATIEAALQIIEAAKPTGPNTLTGFTLDDVAKKVRALTAPAPANSRC